jgi:hypothetical protein
MITKFRTVAIALAVVFAVAIEEVAAGAMNAVLWLNLLRH